MENKGYREAKVIFNQEVGKNIYKIRLEGEFEGDPGQFYMLRAWNKYPYLSRPISIHDKSKNYIEFLYAKVGEGTEIISDKKKDETIYLLGPLGRGFNTEKEYNNVAIVCGGIGIAPMIFLAKELKAQNIDIFAGFGDEVYTVNEFEISNVQIATEDGSIGEKGFVTDLINDKKYDTVFVCGPNKMMKKVKEMDIANETYVSLEAHMGCGIGACLGCQIKTTNGGILKICNDGPVFNAGEVEIDA